MASLIIHDSLMGVGGISNIFNQQLTPFTIYMYALG